MKKVSRAWKAHHSTRVITVEPHHSSARLKLWESVVEKDDEAVFDEVKAEKDAVDDAGKAGEPPGRDDAHREADRDGEDRKQKIASSLEEAEKFDAAKRAFADNEELLSRRHSSFPFVRVYAHELRPDR